MTARCKISRFADNDRADNAALVRLGLTSAQAIEERATQALHFSHALSALNKDTP